jgi:NAD(P)-dependent dehydrogenase (short-subunit alcohol dehydrogenase family)
MVVTENIDKRLTPEKKAMEMAAIPAQRGAESIEVADAVLFLIGNAYITGSMINVSGGMYYEA